MCDVCNGVWCAHVVCVCLCCLIVPAGREPDSTDIMAMHGATAFKLALERANSLDGDAIRIALVRPPWCVCVCVCSLSSLRRVN